ncbi:MAG: GGDEF domain-containing protein [Planctomycetota bacterium]
MVEHKDSWAGRWRSPRVREGSLPGFGLRPVAVLSVSQIQQLAKQEFARAKRYDYPLTLALCRIDRIDSLADFYGRESRTLLMQRLAELFKSRSRTTDLLGRFGEDRLLWVLPHTAQSGARTAAERIRLAVEGLEVFSGEKTISVTLSIGLASYLGGNTLFFDSILFQAERALERAQARGGNAIEEHPLADMEQRPTQQEAPEQRRRELREKKSTRSSEEEFELRVLDYMAGEERRAFAFQSKRQRDRIKAEASRRRGPGQRAEPLPEDPEDWDED